MKSTTEQLVSALRVLSVEIHSEDGVANAVVADAADRIQALVELTARQSSDIKRLEDWKQSALEIEREWDANAVAAMLKGKLGESHRKVIQREVPKLLARIKRLEAGDAALNYSIGLDLQKENDALKQHIKRMEEAGDKLHWAWMHPFDTLGEKIIDNWRKAKKLKL